MKTPSSATKEGTGRFIERHPEALGNSSYRRFRKMRISSIGIGTYLGAADAENDRLYERSIERAIELGSNVIDTALVYRHMRSERIVGQTLDRLFQLGTLKRDEIIICTKGGFFPYDSESGFDSAEEYRSHNREKFGIVDSVSAQLNHSLDPDFLWNQIAQSQENLGLETIDLFYIHNPEVQRAHLDEETFYKRLAGAFSLLQRAVQEGKIRAFGLATWQGFRVPETEPQYLSLDKVLRAVRHSAESVSGGTGSEFENFAAVQLPLNLSKTEAVSLNKQAISGKSAKVSFSAAAVEQRLPIFASAALDQGKLTKYIPPVVKQHFQRMQSDAQVAVQFSRSCPGIASALVGMKNLAHVEEIFGLFRYLPESPENFVRLFESPERSLVR